MKNSPFILKMLNVENKLPKYIAVESPISTKKFPMKGILAKGSTVALIIARATYGIAAI